MSGIEGIGKFLIGVGLFMLLLGGLFILADKLGIERLPGDIFIQKGKFTFCFPIVSSIILSLLLTILFDFLHRR